MQFHCLRNMNAISYVKVDRYLCLQFTQTYSYNTYTSIYSHTHTSHTDTHTYSSHTHTHTHTYSSHTHTHTHTVVIHIHTYSSHTHTCSHTTVPFDYAGPDFCSELPAPLLAALRSRSRRCRTVILRVQVQLDVSPSMTGRW